MFISLQKGHFPHKCRVPLIYTEWSESLCAPDDYSTKIPTKLMIWRCPSQNIFGMWTVLYRTRSSRTQFGVSINVWRLAGDTLNITFNLLYCNHQVHRDFSITLYIIYIYIYIYSVCVCVCRWDVLAGTECCAFRWFYWRSSSLGWLRNMHSNIFLSYVPALKGAVEVTELLLPPRKTPACHDWMY